MDVLARYESTYEHLLELLFLLRREGFCGLAVKHQFIFLC